MKKFKCSENTLTGRALIMFKKKHKLSTTKVCWVLGLSHPNKLYDLGNRDAVLSPTLALLIRVYERFPDLMPLTREVDINKLNRRLDELSEMHETLTKVDLPTMVGKKTSSMTKWGKGEVKPNLTTQRLLKALESLTLSDETKPVRFQQYINILFTEGNTRGIENVLTKKGWNAKT